MQEPHDEKLESLCRELSKAYLGVLEWKWDNRFATVLGEFPADNKEQVREILERYLSASWDGVAISEAPDVLQMIAGRLGGLRAGQHLFATESVQDDFIFAVWWPWGNGQTISVRIAPFVRKVSGPETSEFIAMFRGWFGL